MLKRLFSGALFLLMVSFFQACSNSFEAFPDCPNGFECTNLKAYSFVYYSGKNTLDTITETTDKITCDIYEGYFKCTVKKIHSNSCIVYTASASVGVYTETPEENEVLTRVDTTYINYGRNRLMDYVPPYEEKPKVDVEKMRAAFDTVIVKQASYSDSIFMDSYAEEFVSWFDIDYDYNDFPDWAYLSDNSGRLLVFDGKDGTPNADTVYTGSGTLSTVMFVNVCSNYTSYVDYPKPVSVYGYSISVYSKEPIENDTTITWTAYFENEDGEEDSTEVTTFFKINKRW